MTLASLEKIERRFGDLLVLDGAGLQVDEKTRIGIVGSNGAGKTTLIEILAGHDEADRGSRNLRRGLRIAYAKQVPELRPGDHILDYVQRGDGGFLALEEEVRRLEEDLAQRPNEAELLERYGTLQAAFEAGGGYDRSHLCERVLTGIGFPPEDWDKDVSVLSGGERSRLVLASLMTAPADLLILDEPTNHLDLEGIEFVQGFVQSYPGAVVIVSHDRDFLDAVATHIVEVEGGTTSRFKGNYGAWRKQKDAQLLAEARAYKNRSDFFAKEMEYIRRNMAGRMSSQAKGRLKRLQRLQMLEMPKVDRRELRLKLGGGRGQSGQTMIDVEGLGLTVGEGRVLVETASFRIEHGEVVGLVGRNGSGKTTLMRTLAGQRAPDAGEVRLAWGIRVGYFSQEVSDLPQHLTVLQALREIEPGADEKTLRDHLALFLFSGDRVEDQVSDLSGGEKQRLALARLTRTDFDLLCLDEPTNHLDVTGREGLERALGSYSGAVLLISHDRKFLSTICDRFLDLSDRTVFSVKGGLDAVRAARAERARAREQARVSAKSREKQEKQATRPSDSGKLRNPILFQKLENKIMELEEQLSETTEAMSQEENYRDHERMQELRTAEDRLRAELAEAYEQWENWS